jgi:ferrous iron transport protein B
VFLALLFSWVYCCLCSSRYLPGRHIQCRLIEDLFVLIQGGLRDILPAGPLTDLLIDGVVAGLSGVMVFIPQIAILFAFISILEDTGYMSRVTFMMDKIMRKVGLNGKSVVPLIGGFACAVPSIMSTRTIENWKDRMITIMVTPLVACSARLPVYTLLIALVVPNRNVWWIFNLQGLALTGMYLLSLVSAVVVAYVMKFILKSRERGYFIMELPVYRMPRWNNVLFSMYERQNLCAGSRESDHSSIHYSLGAVILRPGRPL